MWQSNFAVRRQFRLTEKMGMQLKVEAFNLFNHPNFASPINTLLSATFGQSIRQLSGTGTGGAVAGLSSLYQLGGPRSFQVALKLTF